MATTSFLLDTLSNGSGARLTLGSAVLVYLIAYNETTAPCVVLATIMATLFGILAARCKTSLKTLQIPYIRASNKFDFGCLFLATWMEMLAILCACGALARTLSMCLDAMTGGLARIMILGRNSPANEPWPDVLGVGVVFLVTGMFMLGLEHSKAFSFIMALAMFGLNAILSAVGWWNGDAVAWHETILQPNGFKSLLTATALLTFSFPGDYPTQRTGWQRFTGFFLILLVTISLLLASGCLTTILHYKATEEYVAVPLFHILDENNFHKLVPAAACMLMLTVTGGFLELFPELYRIIVRFATSEWRILTKQIAYESSDSGNPVLAVFIAGSLCAMLSFACPLQNLSHTLAASHMCAVFFRAFYLLYSPFRPKFILQSNTDSSLSYSRLSTEPITHSSSASRLKRSLWNLSVGKQVPSKKPKTKPKNKQEVEKEWLLLGEPTSPCPQRESKDVESTILSDGEPPPSDFEYPDKFDNSDSDTSTDIDAIVDEYRQKVKVTTAGPLDRTARVPTVSSWRVTIFAIIVVFLGIALSLAGIYMQWPPAALTGSIGVFIISLMMPLIPKYTGSVVNISPVICCTSIFMCGILFASCAQNSWPAIVFWMVAGLIMLIRCDNLCCTCLQQTSTINEQLIPSVSAKTTSSATTTIRMPRPPKSIVTIPTRVNAPR
ncbi:torn and diminished rhabdomeres isoform 2-T2 [Cochliomyia hominivorax]